MDDRRRRIQDQRDMLAGLYWSLAVLGSLALLTIIADPLARFDPQPQPHRKERNEMTTHTPGPCDAHSAESRALATRGEKHQRQDRIRAEVERASAQQRALVESARDKLTPEERAAAGLK